MAGGSLYRVGLTGSIASGKSAVSSLWAELGAAVVDADDLARRAVEPGTTGLDRIREEFGPAVISVDGSLDRAAMRRLVFDDAGRRHVLEAIVHPEVAALREKVEDALQEAGERVVVHVIPLLFETDLQDEFDAIVLIDSPEPVRHQRLTQIRGLSGDEATAMIEAQMSSAGKRKRLDDLAQDRLVRVIDNDGTLEQLQDRARAVWRDIMTAAPLRNP